MLVLHARIATAAKVYTTMGPLLLLAGPHAPTSQPTVALVEPPDTRTRRARLQRDGIGANGTFNPLPVTVNPCPQPTPPSIVVEGSAETALPPGRFVPRVEQLGMMGVRSVVGEVLPCAARAWFTEVLWGVWAAPGAAAAAVADPPTTQRLLLMCRLS